MGARVALTDVGGALFGKTRRAVLALLYGRPDEAFYLRQVTREAQAGQGAVQRELQRLAGAGILTREARGRVIHYQANRGCPIFAEL
jgi:predicted transcriptional regulator